MSKTKKEEKIPDDSDIMGLSLNIDGTEKRKVEIEISERNLNNLRNLALFNNSKVSELVDFLIELKIESLIEKCKKEQSFEPMIFYHLIDDGKDTKISNK